MWKESIILSIVSGAAKYVFTYFPSWRFFKKYNSCLPWERSVHWNANTATECKVIRYLRNNIFQVHLKAKGVWRAQFSRGAEGEPFYPVAAFGCNSPTTAFHHSVARIENGASENNQACWKAFPAQTVLIIAQTEIGLFSMYPLVEIYSTTGLDSIITVLPDQDTKFHMGRLKDFKQCSVYLATAKSCKVFWYFLNS